MLLPVAQGDPFQKMLAHPEIVRRKLPPSGPAQRWSPVSRRRVSAGLNWMGGSGYRCGGGTLFCAEPGTSGHTLHDGNEAKQWNRGYDFKNGRSYCETVTVAWQLRDVEAGMGGFMSHNAFAPLPSIGPVANSDELGLLASQACVPGSHKTQFAMPRGIRECDDTMGIVAQPIMKAGSVLFFVRANGPQWFACLLG